MPRRRSAEEPDDHQHGQADALEVFFLQGRETDAAKAATMKSSLPMVNLGGCIADFPMSDPCILISSAKAVNDLAGEGASTTSTCSAGTTSP